MSETTIKFLLDDFKLINNPGSIDVLQLDLFEPQELEENMISYFIFVGPTLELNKIFHHRNISEKHALLGKKISFKLKEGRSSDQFYNYENVWSNKDWFFKSATSKSNLKSSHEGGTKIEKDCLLLSVFDSKEEKNDISSFEISNENSALTIEKDYLIDILKINPASEEKIAELDAEIKKFEEKAGNDENKKWAWNHFSRGNFSGGKKWADIKEEWGDSIDEDSSSTNEEHTEEHDEEHTEEHDEEHTEEHDEEHTKPDPLLPLKVGGIILVVVLVVSVAAFLFSKKSKKKEISKNVPAMP